MIKVNVYNPQKLNKDDIANTLSNSLGNVKNIMGIANSLVFTCMTNTLDILATHPSYRRKVKRDFELCRKEWKVYEYNLCYSHHNNFFSVDKLEDKSKSNFKEDMTNKVLRLLVVNRCIRS